MCALLIFFFFQAEDGIRDVAVTGVQTCALPISHARSRWGPIKRLPTASGMRTAPARSTARWDWRRDPTVRCTSPTTRRGGSGGGGIKGGEGGSGGARGGEGGGYSGETVVDKTRIKTRATI